VYRLLLGTVVGALAMCLNLGGLTLLHVRERRRELALRAVLGATPWRIRRQLFTEMSLTVALALPGACAWCGWLMNLLFTTLTPSRGRAWPELQGGVGWLVLCSLVALAMTLLCGLLPASIVTRPDVASSLWQAGTRNPEGPWLRSMRGTLIAAQIALGCVLLSMSGAAVRAVRALAGSELGYRPEGLVFASLYDARGDQRDAQVRQAYVRVLEKVRSQPGVRAAAISLGAPLYGIFSRDFFERQGDGPAARTSAVRNVVMPGYFEAMGIPLLQGRDFGDADSALEHHVVILGEKLARRLFPDGGAVGQTLLHRSWFGPLPLRVIGVAGDVRRGGYAGAMDDDAYVSMNAYTQLGTDLIVRLDPDQMNTLMTQLPGWLPATDGILLGPPWAFPAGLERSLQSERRLSGTLLAFGTAATLLSVLGVFALTSHNVQRRTRELSIRVALGCPARRILWLVLAPVTGWVVLGIGVAGALLGCVGDRVMLALSAGDGSPMAAFPWAAVVLALCALAACVGPTSRALRVSGGLAVREP
jgi:predicted permease